jgi:hypothetical protein
VQTTDTQPEPYTVLIGGEGNVASRLTGSIPRQLPRRDVAIIRAALARGDKLEIRTASRASWDAMKGPLFSQIGLRP